MPRADRLALNSLTTPAASLDEFTSAASDAGFRLVECAARLLSAPIGRVRDALDASGLSITGVSPSDPVLDWHWQWNSEIASLVERELHRAAALDAAYYVLPFMRPHGDRSSVESALADIVPMARAEGIAVAVEPIGHFDVLRRAEDLAPLLRRQDPDVVALLLDSFHFFRAGHEVADLELYADLPVAAVQLSNVNDRTIDDALGYRDRTFPLDGRWPVVAFTEKAALLFPDAPLIVEVIGEVAAATPTREAAERAYEQLIRMIDRTTPEATHD